MGSPGPRLGSQKLKVASELIDFTARELVHSRHGFDFWGNGEERGWGSLHLVWLESSFFRPSTVGQKGRNKAST